MRRWTADPRETATHALRELHQVKTPPQPTAHADPDEQWRTVADQTDPRLTAQSDWPALAALMQTAHDHGLNVGSYGTGTSLPTYRHTLRPDLVRIILVNVGPNTRPAPPP